MVTGRGIAGAWLSILVLAACSPTPPTSSVPGPAGREDPGPGPVGPDLWRGGRGIRWQAETTIRVRSEGEDPRVFEDLRQMDRTPEGDFQVVVRRRGPSPSGGTAEESFTAISVGSALWTRGSGGPFVAWEDPAAAIREFERLALEGSADLYRIATRCGRQKAESGQERWTLDDGPCGVPEAQVGGSARVERLDLTIDRSGDVFRALSARVLWTVSGEDGAVAVEMEHRARLDDLPRGEALRPPEDVVPARRERPVRMARQVLSGLGEWGPGAPWRDRGPTAPGTP